MKKREYDLFDAASYLSQEDRELAEKLTECTAEDYKHEDDMHLIERLKEMYPYDDSEELIRKFLIIRKVKKLRFFLAYYVSIVDKNISKILEEMKIFLSQEEIKFINNAMLEAPLLKFYDESWECADSYNIRNTVRITGEDTEDKIKLLLDYAVDERRHGRSIADPWYSGDFTATWNDVTEGLEGFMKYLGYF